MVRAVRLFLGNSSSRPRRLESTVTSTTASRSDWYVRLLLRSTRKTLTTTLNTVFLPANVLKHRLLEPNVSMEVTQISNDALVAALATIRTVLQSAAYSASVKYSGYLMRVRRTRMLLIDLLTDQHSCRSISRSQVYSSSSSPRSSRISSLQTKSSTTSLRSPTCSLFVRDHNASLRQSGSSNRHRFSCFAR